VARRGGLVGECALWRGGVSGTEEISYRRIFFKALQVKVLVLLLLLLLQCKCT
jgi:hypothetical protein